MSALQRSIDILGGQTALAKEIGVSQSHVWNWLNRENRAPAKYIRVISKATEGKISIEDLLRDYEDSSDR
ncbi:TPA: helix-turn-helix domain-containing protein [Vibrio vulnificus]